MEVEFVNVTKKYGNVTAVSDFNLKIHKGALHFLLGPSGCGKTTTLRMLAGLESVSQGKILFNSQDVTNKPSSDRGIGMVFQNYALWPHMTVRQNVEYGLKLRKLSSQDIRSRMAEALSITQLTAFESRLPGQLSGGQQQRVALARALAIRPNVLLLDEPLSNLDAKLRLEMRDNISKIHRETGITTFYVTHDQKEALSMGTHITVMHDGVKIQTGTPKKLYLEPVSPFLAAFIGETNIIRGRYLGRQKSEHGDSPPLHLIETPFGTWLSSKCEQEFSLDQPVDISVRPEAIKVQYGSHHPSNRDNFFTLHLTYVTYLGEMEQLSFSFMNHHQSQLLKVNLYNIDDHDFIDGQPLTCFIDPSHVIVLPAQDGFKNI